MLNDAKMGATVVGGSFICSVVFAQLFTQADPIGTCWRFYKQLGDHVRQKQRVFWCLLLECLACFEPASRFFL
jgi:hypothetical protein